MESSDLKRGIEVRKSIRMPHSTKRMAPAPPLPPRDDNTHRVQAPPPLTSLRQVLGESSSSTRIRVGEVLKPRLVPVVVGQESVLSDTAANDKPQLAVRADGAKLPVDDGVHKLNLRNLQIVSPADNNNTPKMIGQPAAAATTTMAPPPTVRPLLTARKMAPLSPSLVRRISSLNNNNSQQQKGGGGTNKITGHKVVTTTTTGGSSTAAQQQPMIKLSDLDGLDKRRDYVNQGAALVVTPPPTTITTTGGGADIPQPQTPADTSLDVLDKLKQQITDMENEVHHNKREEDPVAMAENAVTYKDRLKMSKRYGEKEELNLKHGTSDVASNQLLGYLDSDETRGRGSSTARGDDDQSGDDHGSEGEDSHHNHFQRGSSVRKSTGGAVMARKPVTPGGGGGMREGRGKVVIRTASDTKNLETKVKMMRERDASAANSHHGQNHHYGPSGVVAAANSARRAEPSVGSAAGGKFSYEKHLRHKVTSSVVGNSVATGGQHHHHHHNQPPLPQRATDGSLVGSGQAARVQSVHSHVEKGVVGQVKWISGGCTKEKEERSSIVLWRLFCFIKICVCCDCHRKKTQSADMILEE